MTLLTFLLPPRILSPNGRTRSFHARARIVKKIRHIAKMKTLAAMDGTRPAFTGYSLAFHWPDCRRRDDDNAEACTKAYRDGIADALGVDDHTLRKCALTVFSVDRLNPRMEITLHP